jgi:hypothetical protein
MDSTKWPMPSGFDSTASAPSAHVNDGVIFELYMVNMMIRKCGETTSDKRELESIEPHI